MTLKKSTKITLENENGTYSIEVDKIMMNLDDMQTDLLEPVLLAASYHPTIVKELFQGEL